jgi:hypothetical protein
MDEAAGDPFPEAGSVMSKESCRQNDTTLDPYANREFIRSPAVGSIGPKISRTGGGLASPACNKSPGEIVIGGAPPGRRPAGQFTTASQTTKVPS